MTTTSGLSLPEAARQLGVPVRALRYGIRTGKLPAPPHLTATTPLSAEWLASAQSAIEASPKLLASSVRQRVPAFARYEGTSAWRKYRNRVRDYARHQAAADQTAA